jgi:hypothetical protein
MGHKKAQKGKSGQAVRAQILMGICLCDFYVSLRLLNK